RCGPPRCRPRRPPSRRDGPSRRSDTWSPGCPPAGTAHPRGRCGCPPTRSGPLPSPARSPAPTPAGSGTVALGAARGSDGGPGARGAWDRPAGRGPPVEGRRTTRAPHPDHGDGFPRGVDARPDPGAATERTVRAGRAPDGAEGGSASARRPAEPRTWGRGPVGRCRRLERGARTGAGARRGAGSGEAADRSQRSPLPRPEGVAGMVTGRPLPSLARWRDRPRAADAATTTAGGAVNHSASGAEHRPGDPTAHADASAARIVAVVVTYNREQLLADCLDALAAQDRRPDAVVVIDNASSDASG